MEIEGAVWLAANRGTGKVREMENEGDYSDDEVLVRVTVEDGRVWARLFEKDELRD